jgi:alkaline phosphatase D
MLGKRQEEWLDDQMSHAKNYTWNLIAQTTVFGSRRFPRPDGSSRIWNDGWDGYPAARQRLIEQLIKNRVSHPVILGGDVHGYYVGHLLENYEKQAIRPIGIEIITSNISGQDGYKITPTFLRRNPHWLYAEGARRGYVMLDLTSREMRISLRSIQNQRTPESQIETLAEFRLTAGSLKLDS